jgi:NADPH2:quinone reductase
MSSKPTPAKTGMPEPALSKPTRGFVLDAFGPPDVMRLQERDTAPPAADEVLVDVEAAGVNFGDTMIRRGEYLRNQPLSMAPGCEIVGRVAVAGAASGMAVGTRVAGWVEAGGAYADRVIVPARRSYPVPEDLPAAAIAAVFLQGTTADYAVHRYGALKAGETLLVHAAAGGVGSLAVQLGRIAGGRVIATASSEAKRELARADGADLVLDSRDPHQLAARLLAATDGRGCDVIVDGVGGPLFKPSLRALAVCGRYVVIGSASQEPALIDARHLLPRNQTICGFILAHITAADPDEPRATLLRLCALVRDGALSPRYETVPLGDAPEVHRRIEDRSLVGKAVLEP